MINFGEVLHIGHTTYSILLITVVAAMLWYLSKTQEKRSMLPAIPKISEMEEALYE